MVVRGGGMSASLVPIALGVSVVACVFTLGCSKGEKQECASDEELTAERDELREEKQVLQGRVTDLEGQVAKLTTDLGDLQKAAVISDEHLLLEVARKADTEDGWLLALEGYERFVAHYPKSKSSRLVNQRLKDLRAKRDRLQEEQEARAAAKTLDKLSIADIFANLPRYQGMTIRRSVVCQSPRKGYFDERPFYAPCTLPKDRSRELEVYFSEPDLKLIARLPARDDFGTQVYSFTGYFKILARGYTNVEVEFVGFQK